MQSKSMEQQKEIIQGLKKVKKKANRKHKRNLIGKMDQATNLAKQQQITRNESNYSKLRIIAKRS